ncbi:SDR family NAD(P)-dependent oxidoreductase [Oceanicola sp. 22II-s10i]|uniref:SDR family NAD(P)-dependent oxidoreductase n=1 Tax=Oceanicola sp. 22II-s10i TaxID=1317116 RepID=UPI000B51F4A4|nr:SDR family NAD(P)-dependent oxidoreductase [Oceanicola sp. 22II-s10i]
MKLQGRTAIVTGAGRGIGREVALLLAEEGAHVWAVDPGVGRGGEETEDRPADEVVAEIRDRGGKAEACYDTVSDFDKMGELVNGIVRDHGKIDIVVNTAGVLRERMIWNMTEDEFDMVINVHLKGHWNLCHHAVRHMRKANYGRIVNFASDAFKGSVGQCNYAAAKGGIISLTRSIAKETQRNDITCNVICPAADTRMTLTEAVKANRQRKYEAGLMTKEQYERTMIFRGPEHIAPMVAYLTTPESWAISGQNFHIEMGKIHTYYYGEEQRGLVHGADGMFTLDELMSAVPNSLMNGLEPIVPKTDPALAGSEDAKAKSA